MKKENNKNYNYFIKLYEFLNSYNLSISDKIIYGIIKNSNKDNCILKTNTLSKLANVSKQTVINSLNNLKENNLIDYTNCNGINKIIINISEFNNKIKSTSFFIPVHSSILFDTELPTSCKIVYSLLITIAKNNKIPNTKLTCSLFTKDFCKICGITKPTYYKSLKILEEKSYIKLIVSKEDKRVKFDFANILKDLHPLKTRQKF